MPTRRISVQGDELLVPETSVRVLTFGLLEQREEEEHSDGQQKRHDQR